MRIVDITRELLSAPVYDGDTVPNITKVRSISEGDDYNLSDLLCCLHSGTHMDAPLHYIDRGYDIASVNLEKCIGEAAVIELSGDENPEKLTELLKDLPERILIKKGGKLTAQTARTLADCGVVLIGVEDMSVGEGDSETEIHRIFLEKGIAVLENITLENVKKDRGFLAALPLKIAGAEGAPVRAVFIED